MDIQTQRQIGQLMQNGQWAKAEAICRQALTQHADDARVLGALSHCLVRLGRNDEAVQVASRAQQQAPDQPDFAINLAQICFQAQDPERAREVLGTALGSNPEHARLHLQLGHLLREFSDADSAALALTHFACALKIEREANGQLPADPAFTTAAAALDRHFLSLNHGLLEQDPFRSADQDAQQRWRDLIDSTLGVKEKAYADPLQRPSLHYLFNPAPRPFYEREEFAWVAELEAHWQEIRAELEAVMAEDAGFEPYVDHTDRQDNWSELQGERTWSAFHLFKSGKRVAENAARCPRTMALLKNVPLASAPGHAPEAFFSVIKPGTEIAPHYGLANTKLAVHLALIIPPDCGIRAGQQTRGWQEGQCLFFDDSYEHEAWNRSQQTRAVLIFDVWNPALSAADVKLIQQMCALTQGWFEYAAQLDPRNPERIYQGV